MSPKPSNDAKSSGRWNCVWECSQCKGPDGQAQRNRADSWKCRCCHKSYFTVFGKNAAPAPKSAGESGTTSQQKLFEKQAKDLLNLQAEFKAYKEGKPLPSADAPDAKTEDKGEEDGKEKEKADKARKILKQYLRSPFI